MDEELAKLVLEVLKEAQHHATDYNGNECPVCGMSSGYKDVVPHTETCRMMEAIKRMEILVNGTR